MLSFILDFLPWILFSYLAHAVGPQYASAAMVAWIGIAAHKRLKKGFVLDWGGLIFFALMLVSTFSNLHLPKLYEHPSLWSNTAIAAIMWISLMIKRPFTLQYAKETEPEEVQGTLLFKRINYYLTLGWSILMTLAAIISALHFSFDWFPIIATTLTTLLFLLGAQMTQSFPNWYVSYNYRKKIKSLPKVNSTFLKNNFAPIQTEIECDTFTIIGTVPEDLQGIYLRNGANPAYEPISYDFPFDGDGMVHAVYFEKGKVTYRNRYIHTKALQNERALDKAIYPGIRLPIPPDPKLLTVYPEEYRRNGAFIKVIYHADQLLACLEANNESYTLSNDLQTLGVWKQKQGKNVAVNAHARVDPETGELIAVNYDFLNRVNIVTLDKEGNFVSEYNIEKQHATVIHDFAITKNYIVILDCPLIFNVDAFFNEHYSEMIQWRENLDSQVMVIRRHDGKVMTKIPVASFWVYHFANAYEQDNQIVVDYMRVRDFNLEGKDYYAHLDRMLIDLQKNQVERQALDESNCEFPRINENYSGKLHRYVYMLNYVDSITSQRLIKYDTLSKTAYCKNFGDDIELNEPQFVARAHAKSEDDGYLLLFSYSIKNKTSSLLILDALNFDAAPIAEIKMPQRVPHGLHGNWIDQTKSTSLAK